MAAESRRPVNSAYASARADDGRHVDGGHQVRRGQAVGLVGLCRTRCDGGWHRHRPGDGVDGAVVTGQSGVFSAQRWASVLAMFSCSRMELGEPRQSGSVRGAARLRTRNSHECRLFGASAYSGGLRASPRNAQHRTSRIFWLRRRLGAGPSNPPVRVSLSQSKKAQKKSLERGGGRTKPRRAADLASSRASALQEPGEALFRHG